MKTNQEIRHQELEQLLADKMPNIKEKARVEAQSTAQRNLPRLTGDSMAFFVEGIHFAYQKLLDEINTKLQIRSHCYAVLQSDDYWNHEQQRIVNNIRKLKEREIDVDAELKKLRTVNSWVTKVLPVVAFVLAFMDGLMNRPFFESVGLTYLESVFAAGGLALVLWGFVHFIFPWLFQQIKTRPGRIGLGVATALASGILFYFLGVERARFITEARHAVGMQVAVSHWPFTLLSVLFFMVACAIAMYVRYERNLVPREERERAVQLQGEKEELRRKIEEQERAFAKLEEERIAEEALATAKIEYGHGLEQQVISSALETYTMYKKENLMHRLDGRPDCFDQKYPFEFVTCCEIPTVYKRKRSFASGAVAMTGVILMAILFSCGEEQPVFQRSVIFAVDETDPLPSCPDSAGVAGFLHSGDNLWDGVRMDVVRIGDTDIRPVETFIVSQQNRTMGNKDMRKHAVAMMIQNVTRTLDTLCPGESSLGHSLIYRTLARHLTDLANRSDPVKELVVWTNCMENSETVNFYDPTTFQELSDNPQHVRDKLEEQIPLPDLHGITAYFIYEPVSYMDNQRYRVASGFFKDWFEEKGITVYLKARL